MNSKITQKKPHLKTLSIHNGYNSFDHSSVSYADNFKMAKYHLTDWFRLNMS